MIKPCKVQRNVNMTIKDGLKNLQFFIQEELEKHTTEDSRDKNLEIVLGYAIYN